MIKLVLTALPWFALLGLAGFFGKWRWAVVLNLLAVAATVSVTSEASRLAGNEDTDQSALGMYAMAGLMMICTFIGALFTLIGVALGTNYRDRAKSDADLEIGDSV